MNPTPQLPKLTDEAVALLPLDAGRAELLEEIMSTSVLSSPSPETQQPPSRRSRWLVPVAAAAAVAAIVASSVLWQQLRSDTVQDDSFAGQLNLPEDQGLVLDSPGWTVDSLGSDGIRFRKGDANLEVTSYPAKSYDSYVLDRTYVVDPPAPGDPIQVLGRAAQMWAYDAQDHTAIREVEDGRWMEFRAQGLDQQTYLALLGRLRLTTEAEFNASLPNGYVTSDERAGAADKIVSDISAVSGAGLPDGSSLRLDDGESQDRYQFGAEVAGAYACAWFESYENAVAHDQTGPAAEAARVLGTSPDWPILKEMEAAGDYPEVLWDLSATVTSGQVPEGYREGLGC